MNKAEAENLDEWFPRGPLVPDEATKPARGETPIRLGVVVGGSLSRGLAVRMELGTPIEEMAVGRYVVIRGRDKRFFGMITDISLESSNPQIQVSPPDFSDPFMAKVYSGTATYGVLHVAPMLVIEEDGTARPVKTVPSHFTDVFAATADDVNAVFGQEDEVHFHVGSPIELEDTRVNLNLSRLVERSVGIFGKSGTGKSYLTRILISGIIEKNAAVNLIFDMHNDYGWEVINELGRRDKGLKQLFDDRVLIFTLDRESSERRNVRVDGEIRLSLREIEPEDLAMLRLTLDLSDSMVDTAYALHRHWGDEWIIKALSATPDEIEDLLERLNVHTGSLSALRRRLERFRRFPFIHSDRPDDSLNRLIAAIEAEKSVVLEFGRYGNALEAYILVANYLTRRIHDMYVEKMERSLGDRSMQPPQLLITIEEAHKFLDPQIARQTIFGTIAREMRKYNVTLLVVDQRPSAIDEEVMSQIGTRITALLDNERDIQAVLTGISGASSLREVLARLETKQQAIIMGHAVPMPVVIRPRDWGLDFYRALGYVEGEALKEKADEARRDLGGEGGPRRL